MKRLLFGACLGFGLLPGIGQAEVRPSDINFPTSREGFGPGYGDNSPFVQLEFAMNRSSDGPADRTVFSPLLRIATPVGRNEVEFAWGFVNYAVSAPEDALGDRSTLRIMNPYVGYYWTWRTRPRQMRIGLGVSAPVSQARTDQIGQQTVDLQAIGAASSLRGQKEIWLWSPERFGVVGHGDYYQRKASGWVFGGALDLVELIGVGDATRGTAGNDFHVQAQLEGALETLSTRTTLRATYANTVTSDADDTDQITTEVESRLRLTNFDLLARFTLPIDGPSGPAFGDGAYWGLMLGISSSTESNLPE